MEEKKRKWSKYSGGGKKSKQLSLEPGMMGFLCTCNFKEKECIRDAYRLLETFGNDAADEEEKKMQVEAEGVEADKEKCEKEEKEEEDIADALDREIKELSKESKKPVDQKKFQYIDTGAKNVIFIRTTLPNPLDIATKIIHELDKTKKSRSRFLLRLIPIQVTCRANINDIKAKSSELFEKYFAQEPKTFSIVFNRHYNNTIQRTEIIEILAALIAEKNPGNKADLKNPEIAVVVEIIKGFCLVSIAPDYFKYKKYNLLELCNVKDDTADSRDSNNKQSEKDAGKEEKEAVKDEEEAVKDEKEAVEDEEEAGDRGEGDEVEEKRDKDVETSPEK